MDSDIELLISSCNISLILLIEQYKKGNISYELFENNVALKLRFLREHIDNIQSVKEKALAKQVLLEYEQIRTDNNAVYKDFKSQV